jgi:hypothetical protein
VSQGDGGNGSFEDKLRALARQVGQSVERLSGPLDVDEIADRIDMGAERVRELAEFAGRWLQGQAQDPSAGPPSGDPDSSGGRQLLGGPHPLDAPTEEQGLALSALDSGRWKVEPGTNELVADGEGPHPSQRVDLVSELRARDWINASGAVTMLGRAALRRWEESAAPS